MSETAASVKIVISEEKPFVEGNIIKAIVFLLFSVIFVVVNFLVENKEQVAPVVSESLKFDGTFYSGKDNVVPDNGIIRFENPQTDAPVNLASKISEFKMLFQKDSQVYGFQMEKGHMWGNFLISNAKVNILIGNVVFIPKNAQFDLVFDGSTATLNVFNGDVYLGFINDELELNDFQTEFSDIFINRLLVPKSSQATINLSKINEQLRPLLFSKLVKEFKLSAVPSTFKESDWVQQNLKKDNKYILAVKQNLRSEIVQQGLTSVDSFFNSLVFWAEENLTYIPAKNENIIFKHLFSYLDNAIYYANKLDSASRDLALTAFDNYLLSLPEQTKKSDRYYNIFDNYLNQFFIFNNGEDLYYISEYLYGRNLLENRDPREYLARLWLEVYVSIDNNFLNTDFVLTKYYRALEKNLTDKVFVEIQNQLFDNLLLRYSYFYKNDVFAMKSYLEKQLLALQNDGQLKDEIKQAFINNKIDFLKRLKVFFFNNEVSVEEAKQIISRLDTEVLDLMPSKDSKVAVIALFEAQLKDLDEFWSYLKDTEYNSSNQYGTTHEERFQKFLSDRKLLTSVGAMFEDVTGNPIEKSMTPKEIEDSIKNIFSAYPEITDLKIGKITNSNTRFVDISANFGGYPVKAVFDRSGESLKEIYAYEELFSDRSIKIATLLPLLKDEFAELAENIPVTEEEKEKIIETHAQRIARNYVANQISKVGFDVPSENVKIVDEANAVYRIDEIYYKNIPEVVVTFDYVASSDKNVKNLLLVVKGNPISFDKTYSLEELRDMVISEKDFAEPSAEFIDVTQ